MISVDTLLSLQAHNIQYWHEQPLLHSIDPPFSFIQENHYWNFMLWHQEDIARITDIDPLLMVKTKRNIDKYNQARNDAMEKIDEWILTHLTINNIKASLYSETPGMMIDRLSIMQLKLYHTKEEIQRKNVTEAYIQKCKDRLEVLQEQIEDLCHCLKQVLKNLETGKLQFKVYRQLKMYNDPELNPQLYRRRL